MKDSVRKQVSYLFHQPDVPYQLLLNRAQEEDEAERKKNVAKTADSTARRDVKPTSSFNLKHAKSAAGYSQSRKGQTESASQGSDQD